MKRPIAILALFASCLFAVNAQDNDLQPQIHTYKTIGTTGLKAHVFVPASTAKAKSRAAIILLHGGGWNAGSPEWMYDDAKHYAGMGIVAVAGEYRLSDQKTITPLDAMSDVRDLIRWVRQNSADLRVNPHRIAVYGASAGGHLAASAAVFPHAEESEISSVPNALILLSPAVSLMGDNWPRMLLLDRASVKDISPADNISKALPPVAVFEGDADTETPPHGVQRFCDEAKKAGGVCEIHLYPHVGHILTRNLDPHAQEMGPFDPDPAAMTDAHAKQDAFLRKMGYVQ